MRWDLSVSIDIFSVRHRLDWLIKSAREGAQSEPLQGDGAAGEEVRMQTTITWLGCLK